MYATKQSANNASTNINTIKLYWQQIRRFKPSFFLKLFCIPLAALFIDTLLPYALSLAVGVFATQDIAQLHRFLWLAVAAGAIGVVFKLIGF